MTIQPRTLSGFRDFLPTQMVAREQLIETARSVFRSFGFSPIDTPVLEYFEILTGKGSEETDRQIYQFEDHGGRHIGMRFDLTVPLARYVAQHAQQLAIPFKRYHMGLVWRGERPQRGRYREFMQCDFDTVGTRSIVADIEMVTVVNELFHALGISDFVIRLNHRDILNGMLDSVGLLEQSVPVLRALDKLEKIGHQKVAEELTAAAGASDAQVEKIFALVGVTGGTDEVLGQLSKLLSDSEQGLRGVEALAEICRGAASGGFADRLATDISIARGLDYYTGTVMETSLGALPSIGSVCSGGRYDDLVSAYSKQQFPGVGASLGLDRMLAALDELGLIQSRCRSQVVFIPFFDGDRIAEYLQLAARLRRAGFSVEVYPEPKKIGQQLKYATARDFPVAIIAGDQELDRGVCQVKDLHARSSEEYPLAGDALEQAVRRALENQSSKD